MFSKNRITNCAGHPNQEHCNSKSAKKNVQERDIEPLRYDSTTETKNQDTKIKSSEKGDGETFNGKAALKSPQVEAQQHLSLEIVDQSSAVSSQEEEEDEEEPVLERIAVDPKDSGQGHWAKKILENIEDSANEHSESSAPKKEVPTRKKTFPSYRQFQALKDDAEALPDVIHTSFEDATADITLTGWEDEWISEARYVVKKWGKLMEPKIDFIYTWVNGSDKAFQDTMKPYELNSTLNDDDGEWLESHRMNRYRDWDELRYSLRSIERYAKSFRNKIQILVNSVGQEESAAKASPEKPAAIVGKQHPLWLNTESDLNDEVQLLAQEDFFDNAESQCLPTFNSLTIENQMYNTESSVDRFFAMSDDMLLGKPHAASDIYNPLFGPTMGFKTNGYNTRDPPTDLDARRFGEKPFLIYTSWLLNRRFGERKRKGQVHFGHSLSRSVMREAIKSFPRPAAQSVCQRFRGETGFQLYSWYLTFHYTIERHREALLWSYIMIRSDKDNNGNLDFDERKAIMVDLEEGMSKEGKINARKRLFYQVSELTEAAGLEAPKVNVDTLWTSLDGPASIRDIECLEFDVNECMAPGFSTHSSDLSGPNPVFSSATMFDRLSRQYPKCGDCLLKLILNRVDAGMSPLLPHADTQATERLTVIKALMKYQYSIIEPDALFVMITNAEQIKQTLLKRFVTQKRSVGQLCLNDDVMTDDEMEIESTRKAMMDLLNVLEPQASSFEKS